MHNIFNQTLFHLSMYKKILAIINRYNKYVMNILLERIYSDFVCISSCYFFFNLGCNYDDKIIKLTSKFKLM